MAKTSDAVKILHEQIEDDTELKEMLDKARLNADIAQMVYDARMTANLTQKKLEHFHVESNHLDSFRRGYPGMNSGAI